MFRLPKPTRSRLVLTALAGGLMLGLAAPALADDDDDGRRRHRHYHHHKHSHGGHKGYVYYPPPAYAYYPPPVVAYYPPPPPRPVYVGPPTISVVIPIGR